MTMQMNGVSESEVAALLESRAEAIRRKDIEALMGCYAGEAVAFDAWGPLRVNAATMRDHWQQCFDGHEGPLRFEHRELAIRAGDGVAFAHCLIGLSGKLVDGPEHRFWGRGSLGLVKVEGAWRIVHEHASAPFDPYTGKVSELTPDD